MKGAGLHHNDYKSSHFHPVVDFSLNISQAEQFLSLDPFINWPIDHVFKLDMRSLRGEEAGQPPRHTSVSDYVANSTNRGHDARRRSSVVEASPAPQSQNVINQTDDTLRRLSATVPNLADLTEDAKHGAEREKKMGFRESFRMYPLGVFFSLGLSLAVIMEGYDTALLGSFWAQPAFAKKYGELVMKDGVETYFVSASWQQAFTASGVASMFGLILNGWLSDKIGYRKTMMGTLVAITLFLFVTFFAVNIKMLLAGYILSGIPWYV